jgi:hypothetical protein
MRGVGALMIVFGVMGFAHDYYARKLGGALRARADVVFDDLSASAAAARKNDAGATARFSFWFDWLQVATLQSGTRREMEARLEASGAPRENVNLESFGPQTPCVEVTHVVKSAQTTALRFVLRIVGAGARENVYAILYAGFLAGNVAAGEALCVVYGIFATAACIAFTNVFLHASRRELARISAPPAE